MDKATDPIAQLEAYDGELPILATNRNQWFGGKARDAGRLDALFAASRFDAVAYVDIELETVRATEWLTGEFRGNDVDLIVSHHDFDATPEREVLMAIIDQCADYGDVAKVATFPNDPSDTLTLLGALHEATQAGIDAAGIAMGELGSHTRVVGHVYGSKLGYAPLADDESEYAPGQFPLRTLRALVDATRIDGDAPATEGLGDDVSTPSGLSLPN
ncbi:type I 3-dehydroquinate dehydratase [Halobellus ruber]